MRFSYFIPNMQEGRRNPIGSVTWEGMLERARVAEELGFDGLWVGEFIQTPPDSRASFPDEPANDFAPIATMAALAVATKRPRITSATVVLPYHDPLILGREIATLDNISGGRITLGTGLGGSAEEFRQTKQRMGPVNRATLMEETILAMRALWTDQKATFQGEYIGFSEVESYPKPVQNPFPIYMAGTAEAVLRRIARLGQGWIEVSFDPAAMQAGVDRLRRYQAEAGRASDTIEVARLFTTSLARTDAEARTNRERAIPSGGQPGSARMASGEGVERYFVGSVDFLRKRLDAYANVAITEMCVSFFEPDLAAALRQLELFATKVMPDFR